MLVQSRSKACDACRKRKVRCDKQRPNCWQCTKDGWECEGYEAGWKEKPKPKSHNGYPQYESQWVLNLKIQDGPNQSHNLQYPRRVRDSVQSIEKGQDTVMGSPSCSLTSRSFALAQKLVGLLEEDMDLGQKIQSLGSFIFYIPSRLGHCQALDDATECICSTYISILQPAFQRTKPDRRQYFTAIKSLRKCILDKGQALSSNVLAAAVLLSWYEILAQNLDNGWLVHIRGCANLIQARGPLRYVTEFDKSLLDAEEGFVSAQAMITCTPSFFASPEWQAAMYRQKYPHDHEDWYYQSLKALNRRVARISIVLSELECLTRHIREKTHTDANIKAVIEHYDDLRHKIQERLERDNLVLYAGADQGSGYIILAKQYLFLWKMDLHLFEMLYLLGPASLYDDLPSESYLNAIYIQDGYAPLMQDKTSKSQIRSPTLLVSSSPASLDPSLPLHPPFRNVMTHSRILNHLDGSISHSGNAIKEFMLLLKQVNPFSTRRIAFLWRMLCTEAKKRGGVHKAFDEMEAWLGALIQEGCLA